MPADQVSEAASQVGATLASSSDRLKDKAASLGANGLINLGCYADPGLFSIGDPAFLCYGQAIKVR